MSEAAQWFQALIGAAAAVSCIYFLVELLRNHTKQRRPRR